MRAVTGIVASIVCLFVCANAAYLPSSGILSGRIAGGSPVGLDEFPFAAALLTNHGSGTFYGHFCGGSILTTTAILSAASCFNSEGVSHAVQRWRARVGSANSNAGGTVHAVRLITSHPGYSWTTGDNDVAVLRATIPMSFVPNAVGAASIAGTAYTLSTNQVSAIGWGQTAENGASSAELRFVQFWVVNHQTCRNRYGALGFTVTDNMMCAGWLDVGVRGQCQGDAGSPLLDNGVVVGVYSWTQGSCAEGWFPSINMWVPAYTLWIVATATG